MKETMKENTIRTVRALYDFEAVEDNELSFAVDDVVSVLDDSDPNWWKGRSHRGTGLFPASFVTEFDDRRRAVQPDEHVIVAEQPPPRAPSPCIDENVLRHCLELLEDADPTGEVADPSELQILEEASMAQAPLIDARLAHIDRQHNLLAEVDVKIRDVLALYDSAVQQVSMMHYQQQPGPMQQSQPAMSGVAPGWQHAPQVGYNPSDRQFPVTPPHPQQTPFSTVPQ